MSQDHEQNDFPLVFLTLASFLALIFLSGCDAGADFASPPAIVKLSTVPAEALYPKDLDTTYYTMAPADPADFGWNVLNKVGVELRGWSASYKSVQGEDLPTLAIPFQNLFTRTEGGAAGAVKLPIFTGNVVDLFRSTLYQVPYSQADNNGLIKARSTVSPLNCHVNLFFEDDHGHKFTLETDVPLAFSTN